MRLSICVPTFNRADFLTDLLQSIADQTGHGCDVEVVISDNASTDHTAAVVAHFAETMDCLVYHRQERNEGPDRNFLKVIELASGDFCWFMGSDDVLEPGAIVRIIEEIAQHPEIAGMSVARSMWDIALRERFVSPSNDRRLFTHNRIMHDDAAIFPISADYFGYLSGNIVRRALWNYVVATEQVSNYFNAYVHVYVMGRMLQHQPVWYYLAEPCVKYRTGNDFFLKDGEFKRLKLDVDGYGEIVRSLYGEDSAPTRRMDNRVMFHVRHRLIVGKASNFDSDYYRDVLRLSYRHYRRYPRFWLEILPAALVPSPLVRLARATYRQTIRPVRLALMNRHR